MNQFLLTVAAGVTVYVITEALKANAKQSEGFI